MANLSNFFEKIISRGFWLKIYKNFGSWLVKAIKSGLSFSYDKELRYFATRPNFAEEISGDIKIFFPGYLSD